MFMQPHLRRQQVTTDIVAVDGAVAWLRHAAAVPAAGGAVDYFRIEERGRPGLERNCRQWLREHLAGHTGLLALDSVGGAIVAVRSGHAEPWADLYGRKWRHALERFERSGTWELIEEERAHAYSLTLNGAACAAMLRADRALIDQYERLVGISSIHVSEAQAAVNAFNLTDGMRVRAALVARTQSAGSSAESRCASALSVSL